MKNLLVVVGFVVEAFGLILTAVGLWHTWKANTDGRVPMWPWLRRCVDFMRYKVLRRKLTAGTMSGSGSGTVRFTGSADGYAHQSLNDEMTFDQRIETVQANALSALKSAAQAHAAVAKEQREREQALKGLEGRLSNTEAEFRAYAQRLVVDGIPMAIGGLAAVGLGLLIQTLANLI